MKKICKTLSVLLIAVMAMFSFSVTVGAVEETNNSQDGLVASITTEKDSFQANEDIDLTFKVTNTNDFAVENVSLEAIIPDGLKLKNENNTSINTVSLASGESLELTLTVVKESSVIVVPIETTEPNTEQPTETQSLSTENTTAVQTDSVQATTTKANSAVSTASDTNNTNGSDNASIKTGNNTNYILISLICLLSLAVAVFACRFKKKAVKYLSLVLCVGISVGSVAVVGVANTMAEETTNEKIITIDTVKYITVKNNEYQIKSIVKYTEPIGKQNNEFIPSRDADSYVNDDLYTTDPDSNHKVIDKETGLQYYNNEIEIFLKDTATDKDIEILCKKYNAIIVGKIKNLNVYKIRLNKSYSYSELQKIISNLNNENYVEEASLNLVVNYQTQEYTPTSKEDRWTNDWDYVPSGANWGVEAIKAPAAWEYIDLMKSVNVGVYDQGFDTLHEDLKNVIKSAKLWPANPKNHGTHVTGIIGAEFENGIGINGISPTATFSLVNYNEKSNKDEFQFKYAMDYLIEENKSKVINISLGQASEYMFAASKGEFSAQEYLKSISADYEKTLKKLIINNDFVICTSAGNDCGCSYYKSNEAPCGYYLAGSNNTYFDRETNEYKNWNGNSKKISGKNQVKAIWDPLALINDEKIKNRIIVVGAIQNESDTTEKYSLCSFSDIGDRVDVVAPGYDIESTVSNNGYDTMCGTSMASPHVAGIAAMLYSLDPDISGDEVKRIICKTATTKVDGYKLVNAESAVKEVLGNGTLSGSVASSKTVLPNTKVDAYLKLKSGTQYVDTTYTNDKGIFSMELPGGSYELRFNKEGYKTATITIKNSKNLITILEDTIIMENSPNENPDKNITINGGDIVTFTGVLKLEDYEINSINKGTVYILDLDNPIKCYLNDGNNYDGKTEFNIDSVQINASDFKKYLGQHINVKGKVMLATTGHHRRDVVLMEPVTIDKKSKYQIYNLGITWEEAKAYCESQGGHLATITSKEEDDYLYNLVKEQGYKSAYFGLERDGDTWKWVTGEDFSYSNWADDEPNNDGSNENYGMYYFKYTDGKWNDGGIDTTEASSNNTAFICEWDYLGSTSIEKN